MIRTKLVASLVLAISLLTAFTACDDNTDTIGQSLADATAGVDIQTATFNVMSQSLQVDSVLSRNIYGYLGRVKDPETGAYITSDFMAQFNCLEGFEFPELDSLVTYDENGYSVFGNNGTIQADSCKMYLFINNVWGDSTQTMKMSAYEMAKPMNEDRLYYSNFDPMEEGYISSDAYRIDKAYNIIDYNVTASERDTSTYMPTITLTLDQPYTDSDGKTYSNYGSYMLQKYYDDPTNYKNAWNFRNRVVPGFYFKLQSGLGNMATVEAVALDVSFLYKDVYEDTDTIDGEEVTVYRDSIYGGTASFWSTEEVLQTSHFSNDTEAIKELANDESCTYLKTPAGIFTELTLPVDDIMLGHENDSIASARIELPRINNTVQTEYALDVPGTLLMVRKDSLFSFFENNNLYDNKTSYVTSWGYSASSTDNSYTFGNISGLVTAMYQAKQNGNVSDDWNKVVLVPVTVETTTTGSSYYSSSSTVTKVTNDMSLASTRMVKGTDDGELKLSIIYSRFK